MGQKVAKLQQRPLTASKLALLLCGGRQNCTGWTQVLIIAGPLALMWPLGESHRLPMVQFTLTF